MISNVEAHFKVQTQEWNRYSSVGCLRVYTCYRWASAGLPSRRIPFDRSSNVNSLISSRTKPTSLRNLPSTRNHLLRSIPRYRFQSETYIISVKSTLSVTLNVLFHLFIYLFTSNQIVFELIKLLFDLWAIQNILKKEIKINFRC